MYLDDLATQIYRAAEPHGEMVPTDALLYRLYALLGLAMGEAVTREAVHDAWAVWTAVYRPTHPALIPFAQLSQTIQDLDERYVRAIRRVMRERSAS